MPNLTPVLPVRVWLGYALPQFRTAEGRSSFHEKLGGVFIPATVQLMAPLGLTAYLPTIVPSDRCPDVPDEVALVFYESFDAYNAARTSSTGGRAYQMLHSCVFNFDPNSDSPASNSGFPVHYHPIDFLSGEGRYFSLFDWPVNWQEGHTAVFIMEVTSGREALAQELTALQQNPPPNLNGVILACEGQCIVVWMHWSAAGGLADQRAAEQPQRDARDLGMLAAVPGLRLVFSAVAMPAQVPMPVTTPYSGIVVDAGTSLCFRFRLRRE